MGKSDFEILVSSHVKLVDLVESMLPCVAFGPLNSLYDISLISPIKRIIILITTTINIMNQFAGPLFMRKRVDRVY